MVICLERDADLHMARLMPLPLTVSCFSKIQIGFTFLVPAHLGSPGQRAVKRVCVLNKKLSCCRGLCTFYSVVQWHFMCAVYWLPIRCLVPGAFVYQKSSSSPNQQWFYFLILAYPGCPETEAILYTDTHTHMRTRLFNGPVSGTTLVGRYQKKHSPTHIRIDSVH